MSALMAMLGASNAGTVKPYVEEVFALSTYTGNYSDRSIVNGLNLAGKGGMTWGKSRTDGNKHVIVNSLRGLGKTLSSNLSDAEASGSVDITAYNADGFSLGMSSTSNGSSQNYSLRAFCRSSFFFDVVEFDGDGANGRTLSHGLGCVPGMIWVKCTNAGLTSWVVYHRGIATAGLGMYLNGTNAQTSGLWTTTEPTDTHFTLSNFAEVNGIGRHYVAFLFAHDTAADGVIQHGVINTDGTGKATINLGWEPQWLMIKPCSVTGNWDIMEYTSQWETGPTTRFIRAESTVAENTATLPYPTPTGFVAQGLQASQSYVYTAIRRPNKAPTSGMQVLSSKIDAATTATTASRSPEADFEFDLAWMAWRSNTNGGGAPMFYTKPTGRNLQFSSSNGDLYWARYDLRSLRWVTEIDTTANSHIFHYMRKAKGFMTIVTDTGTGSSHAISHDLGVMPELLFRKARGGTGPSRVWHKALTTNEYLSTELVTGKQVDTLLWNSTAPNASVFSVGTSNDTNSNSQTFVTVLFATLDGISKVGSYTGNGTSQAINCGFAAGARLVLVKRDDTNGNWNLWDSARGITAGNDPFVLLNTLTAEITSDDSIDPDATGFIVNQTTNSSINTNGGSYIYLAIA